MNNCNDDTGCALPQLDGASNAERDLACEAQIVFVTDPICSHCWAIEPAWRRLNLEYQFNTRYIHGGLLPGWEGFADGGNGIAKPTDVIPHWQHVAQASGQPINPSVWATDPLSNSYILCKAAIAVRQMSASLESVFVRKMRELVFIDAINIAKIEVLIDCVAALGLAVDSFVTLLQSDEVERLFIAEQREMYLLGARGFPSLIFLSDNSSVLVGARPYAQLESMLLQHAQSTPRKRMLTDQQKLKSYASWTLTEAMEVLQTTQVQAKVLLSASGFCATGPLWC